MTKLAVSFNAGRDKKSSLTLEDYILKKVRDGYRGREIVRELGISDNKIKNATIAITEIKKYLVRFPMAWRELIK